MAVKKKSRVLRPWTAVDMRTLKGLAKKKAGVDKIARALKRSGGAVAVMASKQGISLSTR